MDANAWARAELNLSNEPKSCNRSTDFQRAGKTNAATEYEEALAAFWKNYERLKAECLAREAAKSDDKKRR
jgi:hypothetical protein